jgi:membrane-associated phospholipid phosphatase
MISSITLEKREERKYPIIVTVIFYVSNYYFLSKVHLPAPYLFFLLAGMFSLLTTLIVTYFWKISMHMTGIGGLCGAFLLLGIVWPVDIRFILAGLFVIAGMTGTSRLLLNAHTPAQVAAGFFAGFLPQLSLLLLVR